MGWAFDGAMTAGAMFSWCWVGWELAMQVRRSPAMVVPIHVDRVAVAVPPPLPEWQRVLRDQTVAVAHHARLAGVGIVFALHSVPHLAAPGPDVERRR
jgi:hypothetical protein